MADKRTRQELKSLAFGFNYSAHSALLAKEYRGQKIPINNQRDWVFEGDLSNMGLDPSRVNIHALRFHDKFGCKVMSSIDLVGVCEGFNYVLSMSRDLPKSKTKKILSDFGMENALRYSQPGKLKYYILPIEKGFN